MKNKIEKPTYLSAEINGIKIFTGRYWLRKNNIIHGITYNTVISIDYESIIVDDKEIKFSLHQEEEYLFKFFLGKKEVLINCKVLSMSYFMKHMVLVSQEIIK